MSAIAPLLEALSAGALVVTSPASAVGDDPVEFRTMVSFDGDVVVSVRGADPGAAGDDGVLDKVALEAHLTEVRRAVASLEGSILLVGRLLTTSVGTMSLLATFFGMYFHDASAMLVDIGTALAAALAAGVSSHSLRLLRTGLWRLLLRLIRRRFLGSLQATLSAETQQLF